MSRRSRERGIALISVLWVLLLLSGLASAAAFMARTSAILTHKLGELAQAESATDAAIVNAIAMLSDEKTSRHPAVDGQAQVWEFQGFPVSVSISKEAGRIDLNTASDGLIRAFLYSRGIGEDHVVTMLSNLRAYQHAENGPASVGTLRSVEELRQIPSWAVQSVDCWMDSITVYTGLPHVNASDAGTQVTAALKWANDHHVDNRDWVGASITAATNVDQSLLGEVIRINASTSLDPGISVGGEWIGRLTGDAHQPTLTMKWRRMSAALNSSCKNNVK
jgi:hypothetical protein